MIRCCAARMVGSPAGLRLRGLGRVVIVFGRQRPQRFPFKEDCGMHVTLIHNPSAGDGAQFGRDALLRLVRAAGHDVTYQSTKERKWATALQQPADLIAVAGGDGTIAKVAKRILGRGVPLTVLPMGTANNVARTFGLADRPLEQLVAEWKVSPNVSVDAALAKGPWGQSYFIESLGIGL